MVCIAGHVEPAGQTEPVLVPGAGHPGVPGGGVHAAHPVAQFHVLPPDGVAVVGGGATRGLGPHRVAVVHQPPPRPPAPVRTLARPDLGLRRPRVRASNLGS